MRYEAYRDTYHKLMPREFGIGIMVEKGPNMNYLLIELLPVSLRVGFGKFFGTKLAISIDFYIWLLGSFYASVSKS